VQQSEYRKIRNPVTPQQQLTAEYTPMAKSNGHHVRLEPFFTIKFPHFEL
jgi:hypothetical protein